MNTVALAFGFLLLVAPAPLHALFPHDLNSGSETMMHSSYVTDVSLGALWTREVSGVGTKIQPGYLVASKYAYDLFLRSDSPVPARLAESQGGQKLVTSPEKNMILRWTSSFSGAPVSYRIYLGRDPGDLRLAGETDQQYWAAENLDYLKDYFWRIESIDSFGRTTWGPIYSFSIAPPYAKFHCAPNPFKAGNETAQFIFSMPGSGSAKFSVFALPHLDLVFSETLSHLTDGNNLYSFPGRDGEGKTLFNGVYMAVIEMKGERGEANERFKLLVVK